MYFITLSEMMGTNGEKIARQAATGMGYPFYGEEELMKRASEMDFFEDVKMLDEKGPSLFETLFSERPKIALDRLQSLIYEVAKSGNALFFGRGSQLLLRSFDCAFHVLITGSKEKRIARIMDEKVVGKALAEKMIERSDHDKKDFLRFAFDEDWLNINLYDLVFNTDKLSTDSAVKMVIDAAKSEGIKACGMESLKLLGKLSIQRKIESAFLEAHVTGHHVFYDVEDFNKVRLYGFVHSDEEKEAIERIIKGMQDVEKVTNELFVYRNSLGGA